MRVVIKKHIYITNKFYQFNKLKQKIGYSLTFYTFCICFFLIEHSLTNILIQGVIGLSQNGSSHVTKILYHKGSMLDKDSSSLILYISSKNVFLKKTFYACFSKQRNYHL